MKNTNKNTNIKIKITSGVLAALTLVSISSVAIVPTYAASSTTESRITKSKGIIDKYFSESKSKDYGTKALGFFISKGVSAIPAIGPFLSIYSSDFTKVLANMFGLSYQGGPSETEEAKKEIISEIKNAVNELNSTINVRAHGIDKEIFKLTALSKFEETLDGVSSNSDYKLKKIGSLSGTKNSREKLNAIADTSNEEDVKKINLLAYYLTGKSISELSKSSKYEDTKPGTFSSYLDYQIQNNSSGKQIITNTINYMDACAGNISEAISATKLAYYAKYQIELEKANYDTTSPNVVNIQTTIDTLDEIIEAVKIEYNSVYDKMDTSLFTATVDGVPYVYQAEAWKAAVDKSKKNDDKNDTVKFQLLQDWNGEKDTLDIHHSDAITV